MSYSKSSLGHFADDNQLHPTDLAACELHRAWIADALQQVMRGPWPPVAVLKGPPLAKRLYADTSHRLSSDLDLMIASCDLPVAQACLLAGGYRPKQPLPATWRYFRRHTHHLQFIRPHSPPVELHFRLFTGFGVTIPSEPFLARMEPYAMQNGLAVHVLTPADEFFFLAIHAARHAYRRTIWLDDLRRYLQIPGWSLTDAYALAKRYHLRRPFLHALHQVRLSLANQSTLHKLDLDQLLSRTSLLVRSPLLNHLTSTLASTSKACHQSHPQRSTNLGYLHEGILCDNPAYTLRLWTHHLRRSLARKLHRVLPRWTPQDWAG